MDFKQLEYFVQVAEQKSFSKAAMLLSVAQPFLSKHIRQLEIELKESLFHRNGRLGLRFTEEGALFFLHARKVLEQMNQARKELSDLKQSPTGKITIGTVPDAEKPLAKHLVGAFSKRFPKASLQIIEEKSGTIYEWLLGGRIDIGVLYNPAVSPRIELTPLAGQELYLVSSASNLRVPRFKQIEFAEIEKLPLILPSQQHYLRTLVDATAAEAGIKLNIIQEIVGASFILELVQQGYGHTILAKHSMEKHRFLSTLQTNKIVKPSLTKTLMLAVSSQRSPTRLARETANFVSDIIKISA